ncbi:hypothetical protein GCM10007920_35070 [Ciceribacter naphthalenivorans]|uniref:Uncharacterized protein n=2 Tax=Alphaproteobacteria TaxID=28211 RepID=A0A512HPA7_9HYPH|nr:hypothetical protein RNA01_42270 [Ciceribacter naphthalenivorans]GLR23715.1 hypothetical protein GCM10007920_35070 [Ciceribacter naphthalenivorans]GLT06571.1 hypothetical protein GCM10007926_35070 [Sphingomonas psychrolutea]
MTETRGAGFVTGKRDLARTKIGGSWAESVSSSAPPTDGRTGDQDGDEVKKAGSRLAILGDFRIADAGKEETARFFRCEEGARP